VGKGAQRELALHTLRRAPLHTRDFGGMKRVGTALFGSISDI
jgi:hypothetical protein